MGRGAPNGAGLRPGSTYVERCMDAMRRCAHGMSASPPWRPQVVIGWIDLAVVQTRRPVLARHTAGSPGTTPLPLPPGEWPGCARQNP